jgi:methionyl-tRNA synthetase
MQRIHDRGHTYKGTYEGWYCPRCADFKTEQEIAEGNTCPIHRIPLDREQEENWFFRLSSFQEQLERLYAEQEDFVTPRQRRNEASAFITGGLNDVSLSRSKAKLTWGVEVPWDTDHVFYVWFDALLNYYTALSFAKDGQDLTSTFWPATYQVMAKDILKFHAVFWPAMLMAAGLPLPEHLFIHGYLLMRDSSGAETKMSKSLGNVLDPFEVMDRFGTDALRYYCFREVSFGQDGGVSTVTFGERYEAELANELGNLASRTTAMISRYRDGVVPETDVDAALQEDFAGLREEVCTLLDRAEITQALDRIWQRVRRLNRYVEERAPWQLAKDDARAGDLDVTLRSLAEGLRVVTVLLAPYIPESAERLLSALGQPDTALAGAEYGAQPGGAHVQRLAPLFPKPSE